jgi:hypothetical protein
MGSSSSNAEVNALERLQILILRFEVKIMHGAGKMSGSFESALDECFVDDHLSSDVRQFAPLPGLHLLAHRLEVALPPVDANRDSVDE